MTETRESRISAQEVKFVLDAPLGAHVREWARRLLKADPYGTGPFGDEYHTSSLYFDTTELDVFQRRGSFGRAKYRIRRYSGADYAFIERKLRRPNLLIKRRTQVGLEVVKAIERGDITPTSPAWWFYERLRVRALAPSCLLSYHRTARNLPTPTGLARLTIDDGLHAAPARGCALDDVTVGGEAMLDGQVILELKFRGPLPGVFQDLLRTFGLTRTSASKYRLGMIALGHVPAQPAAVKDLDVSGDPCESC
jgi:hypothetical protein